MGGFQVGPFQNSVAFQQAELPDVIVSIIGASATLNNVLGLQATMDNVGLTEE